MHLPSQSEPFLRVDDHLVEPEVTRDEIVRGVRMVSQPANQPHATTNARLDMVMGSNASPDYEVATDLLTRVGPDSDFASDVALLRKGIDPTTGTRYLEELAIEVVSTQRPGHVTVRAREWTKRGVRRVFAVFIRKQEVREWSRELDGWVTLDLAGQIDDPILVRPIPVRALLDDAVAEAAMVGGLVERKSPDMAARLAAERAQGVEQGVEQGRRQASARAIEVACELLGLPFGTVERARLASLDAAGLDELLDRLRRDRRWP